MLDFLSSFSQPFLLAVLIWPFVAFLLTLPILAIQYRRLGKLSFGRGLVAYAVVLYGLGLVSFTLYPMPENPAEFCKNYALSPQLIPFHFIHDILSDGSRAVLQVVMNLLFFLPLGVFARAFFNFRLRTTILLAFLCSLTIETAQLTGAFGYYPCSYRLFDVDDLMINTLGSLLGYALAYFVPAQEIATIKSSKVVRRAGLVRYTVALLLDDILAQTLSGLVLIALNFTVGHDFAMTYRHPIFVTATILLVIIMPYILKGWSAGSWVVRLNHDDQARQPLRRLAFYAARGIILYVILFPPFSNIFISWAMILVILVVWFRRKKLPYQFV